ncbi:ExbD/TolR family protein [Acidovorax lacteus]|uniref:Protein TolR n=1 Tax=Acidovorax lacteus TaxID=1924988 RepID=A0ABP8KZ67_9BURK
MPATAVRGRGRRTMNEINMVPFIDVMLVLLIIFMVTAPMLTPGMVDVPSVGKAQNAPSEKEKAYVVIDKEGSIQFKTDGNSRRVSVDEIGKLASQWMTTQQSDRSVVLIQADKSVEYDKVMQALQALQAAGIKRAALDVRKSGR